MSKEQKNKAVTAKKMIKQVKSITESFLVTTEKLYLNFNVDYADLDIVVQAVFNRALELNVQRHKKNVTRLIIEGKKCVKIDVEGITVQRKIVIVCTRA